MFGRSRVDNYIYFSQQSDSGIRANERLKEKLDFLDIQYCHRQIKSLTANSN